MNYKKRIKELEEEVERLEGLAKRRNREILDVKSSVIMIFEKLAMVCEATIEELQIDEEKRLLNLKKI